MDAHMRCYTQRTDQLSRRVGSHRLVGALLLLVTTNLEVLATLWAKGDTRREHRVRTDEKLRDM